MEHDHFCVKEDITVLYYIVYVATSVHTRTRFYKNMILKNQN